MTSETTVVIDNSLAERRRYKRERVDLAGRQFEPTENREANCKIVDISPGGARVLSDVVPSPGALLVVYIDGFGRFEGSIVRTEQDASPEQLSDMLGAPDLADTVCDKRGTEWWTEGSPRVPPIRIFVSGLPDAATYASMLGSPPNPGETVPQLPGETPWIRTP
jgi:hypothetical protein